MVRFLNGLLAVFVADTPFTLPVPPLAVPLVAKPGLLQVGLFPDTADGDRPNVSLAFNPAGVPLEELRLVGGSTGAGDTTEFGLFVVMDG